jgi:hypothetical protein
MSKAALNVRVVIWNLVEVQIDSLALSGLPQHVRPLGGGRIGGKKVLFKTFLF